MESSGIASKQRSRVPNWNLIFEFDNSNLQEDASIRDFDGGRAGYIANAMEQALLLPKDMDELRNLKKHKLFLSVMRDLALVRFLYIHFFFFFLTFKILSTHALSLTSMLIVHTQAA